MSAQTNASGCGLCSWWRDRVTVKEQLVDAPGHFLLATSLLCYITSIHFAAPISKVHHTASRPIQFHPTSKMTSTYFSDQPIKYQQKLISKSAARCGPAADFIGLDVITEKVIMK